jgi:hypothetical protein
MKWIALAGLAFFLFLIFRRINREQKSVQYPADFTQSLQTAVPLQNEFALRAPMSFDDFYNRFYASEKFDREFVQKILMYVAAAGGVEAEQLRPEDRLDALPKRTAYYGMKFVEKMVGGALAKQAREQGVAVPEVNFDTLDSLIRQLEPHHVELLKRAAFKTDL